MCYVACVSRFCNIYRGYVFPEIFHDLSVNFPCLLVAGFGFGLVYLPSVISVSYYFERKRAMATGIAVCGAGVGTMVFAPLGRLLLDFFV